MIVHPWAVLLCNTLYRYKPAPNAALYFCNTQQQEGKAALGPRKKRNEGILRILKQLREDDLGDVLHQKDDGDDYQLSTASRLWKLSKHSDRWRKEEFAWFGYCSELTRPCFLRTVCASRSHTFAPPPVTFQTLFTCAHVSSQKRLLTRPPAALDQPQSHLDGLTFSCW